MLPWHTISHVLLDMDGTLLDLHYDNYFWRETVPRRYGARRGLDVRTAKTVLTPLFRRREGTLAWYCLDHWTRELGLDLLGLKREWAHLIAVRPHGLALLAALRHAGKHTILVTNAHAQSLTLKLERTRLDRHLDAVVSAHEVGVPKEDPAFWAHLQRRHPFPPAHTLLLDDTLAVLRSARRHGIAHLLAVTQPDSRNPPLDPGEFNAVSDFHTLCAELQDALAPPARTG